MRLAILISASVIGLSGCANLGGLSKFKPEPTHVEVQELAPQKQVWAEIAPGDLPTTDWVGSFQDPILTNLVSEALEVNTNVKSSAARLDASLARFRISRADKLPTLDTNSRITRTETSLPFQTPTNLSSGVQGWFDLIEARLLSELSERDVETLERALRLTQRRFEGGVTGSSDVRLARSSVANAEALLATREQTLSSLTRNLEILLRRYPSKELQAAEDLPNLPPLSGAGTPGYVLRKRPDLIAAERRLYAQGLQVDIARKNLLPRITLTGNGNVSSTTFAEFLDIDALAIQLVGNFTAPLFQGGRLKGNIEQQEAILRGQLEDYAGVALTAYLEVENALGAEQRLLEREVALRTSLDEAQKAEDRLELRYTEGLATILQLLDAQSRRISAEGQLISARKERLSNRARMYVALGGGFETNLESAPNVSDRLGKFDGVAP